LDGIGTGLEKKLVPEKVPESVSEKFGTKKSLGIGLEKIWYRKKSRNRSRREFGTEKSPGTGLGENLVPKKDPEPVSLDFWVSSHTGHQGHKDKKLKDPGGLKPGHLEESQFKALNKSMSIFERI
jgi:hypothetical protein